MFMVVVKRLGRALWRFLCAIGRFFKLLFKRIVKSCKTGKLKRKIKKNDRAIHKLYTSIGEAYYAAHGDAPEEGLADFCGSVSADLAVTEGCQSDMEALKRRFSEEKAAAKEKAKARRAEDKNKAKAEKERVRRKTAGEDCDEYEPEPIASPAGGPEPPAEPAETPVLAETEPPAEPVQAPAFDDPSEGTAPPSAEAEEAAVV